MTAYAAAPQTVGAHVADRDRLSGSACSGRCSGTTGVVHPDTADETSPDLINRREFTARKGARAFDELSWAIVFGMLGLEHVEDPLGAVGGPPGDMSPFGGAGRRPGSLVAKTAFVSSR